MFARLGEYERQQQEHKKQRQLEYRQQLQQHLNYKNKALGQNSGYNSRNPRSNGSGPLINGSGPYGDSYDAARQRGPRSQTPQQREQQAETNGYPEERSHSQPPPARQPDGYLASLPIGDHMSGKKRRENERNREYNDWLARGGRQQNRQAWNPPQQPVSYNQPTAANPPRRGAPSAAQLEAFAENERKLKELDSQFEQRKRQYELDRSRGSFEDSNWLNPTGAQQQPALDPRSQTLPARATNGAVPSQYYATLPIGFAGNNATQSATRRKKDQYRRDLEQQMQELTDAKNRSRQQAGTRPTEQTNGYVPSSHRASEPQPGYQEQQQYNGQQQYSGQQAPAPQLRVSNEFGSMLGAGGQPTLGPYNSPLDEAYYYYARNDPLTGFPDQSQGQGGQAGGYPAVTPQIPAQAPETRREPQRQQQHGPSARPPPGGYTFTSDEDVKRAKQAKTQEYNNELKRQMEEAKEKKAREAREREEYDRKLEEDIKNYNPWGRGGAGAPMRDQSGKAIADLKSMKRDNDNREQGMPVEATPRFSPPPESAYPAAAPGPTAPGSIAADTPRQTNAAGEATFARGGNGIFGAPKTDAEKTASDRYKAELREQIEQRKREQEERKRLQDEEEARENARIEADQKKIQEEFEAEKQKQRDKEKAKQEREEELARMHKEEQEETKRRKREAIEQKRQQAEEERQRQQQQAAAADASNRGRSPPVPTHAGQEGRQSQARRQSQAGTDSQREGATSTQYIVRRAEPRQDASGPTPTDRWRDPPPIPDSRPPSSNTVLGKLNEIRRQLNTEKDRINDQLQGQRDIDSLGGLRVSRQPESRIPVDVFDVNAPRGANRMESKQSIANPDTINEFNRLRNRNTKSRRGLASEFPQDPTTNNDLEIQQQALIREQEKQLRNVQPSSSGRAVAPSAVPASPVFNPSSLNRAPSGALLQSETPARGYDRRIFDSQATFKPENGGGVSAMTMGSQASLNVDALQERNRRRLQELEDGRETQQYAGYGGGGRDTGLPPRPSRISNDYNAEQDEVLERFMKRQTHERRPSANTLMDDTWMRPSGTTEPRF